MIYRFGNYELDAQYGELRCAGQQVAIEPQVLKVLVYLLEHRDHVVSKEDLFACCWPDTFVSETALTRCLAKVRKTVQPEPDGEPVIKTLYGRGYCFVAPVTVLPTRAPVRLDAAPAALRVAPDRSKILIVDDEPLNVDYLEQELQERGYETSSATNGQEALAQVAADAPDLILLDVMMPVLDGFTVCRMLKAQDETRLIPIIIMTALDAVADRIQGIKAGADDFLTKPVHEEELFARIETSLKLKHTVDRSLGELRVLKEHCAAFVRLIGTPEAPSS